MKRSITEGELREIRRDVDERLIGRSAWGVKLGMGSFVTMEFGNALPPTPEGVIHGEWHLWIYGARWSAKSSIERGVNSDSDRTEIARWLTALEGKRLLRFEFAHSSAEATLVFDSDVRLELSSDAVEAGIEPMLSWMLFLPGGDVLEAGPRQRWLLETAQQ